MEFGVNLNGNDSIILENGTERKHVLLQFYETPNDEQLGVLKEYGVWRVAVAAKCTYIFSMPADYTAADLPSDVGLRWMGEVQTENKYDHTYGLDVPEWARTEDGNVKLAIHFYEDVISQDSANIVKKYSENYSTPSNFRPWYYETFTNETNITSIASEDVVQYVGYYGVELVNEYSSDFVDYEEIIEEDEPDIVEEQENNSQETAENINDSEEKENPGFTATIAILIFVLITVLGKRK
jgi:hypothetical protein